jgi:hypothetical protein
MARHLRSDTIMRDIGRGAIGRSGNGAEPFDGREIEWIRRNELRRPLSPQSAPRTLPDCRTGCAAIGKDSPQMCPKTSRVFVLFLLVVLTSSVAVVAHAQTLPSMLASADGVGERLDKQALSQYQTAQQPEQKLAALNKLIAAGLAEADRLEGLGQSAESFDLLHSLATYEIAANALGGADHRVANRVEAVCARVVHGDGNDAINMLSSVNLSRSAMQFLFDAMDSAVNEKATSPGWLEGREPPAVDPATAASIAALSAKQKLAAERYAAATDEQSKDQVVYELLDTYLEQVDVYESAGYLDRALCVISEAEPIEEKAGISGSERSELMYPERRLMKSAIYRRAELLKVLQSNLAPWEEKQEILGDLQDENRVGELFCKDPPAR